MSDRKLFTPGPLTTSGPVKSAMLRDLGSRDPEFIALVRDVRSELLAVAGVDGGEWAAVPLQGSGTFGVEAVLHAALPESDRLLVLANGAYGRRIAELALRLRLQVELLESPEDQPLDPAALERALGGARFSAVAAVHCETSTGLLNPIAALGPLARAHRAAFVVDAMSSFGAVLLDLSNSCVDWLISSANKCIEGVPGFSFVIARKQALLAAQGRARSVSLDLHAQWRGLERDGQFRFTPPTHALLAFHEALAELRMEGGVAGRARRYQSNREKLLVGMRKLGFVEYLKEEYQSHIITSFLCPPPPFAFEPFYRALFERGHVIYPGKVGKADCFRIGHIGRLFPGDVDQLLQAIGGVLAEQGVVP